MKIIDPHIHMYSRTTDDYERMALAGVVAVVEPAFWFGAERQYVESFWDYFHYLITFEAERAERYQIKHFTMLSLNPREANHPLFQEKVIPRLPEYLNQPGVVGIGEIGFDRITEAEEKAFRDQLLLAERLRLPVLIHTPHQYKVKGTERICQIIQETGVVQERILIDHNTEETLPMVRRLNVWANHSIYPVTKLTPERAVEIVKQYGLERMLISSAADWGVSDPLAVPKTVQLLRRHGFSEAHIEKLVYHNPVQFFSQSPTFHL